MDRNKVFAETERVFQIIFEDGSLKINEDMDSNDISLWDSLHHVTLLSMLQETFNISFDIDEIVEMETVRDIIDTIYGKVK